MPGLLRPDKWQLLAESRKLIPLGSFRLGTKFTISGESHVSVNTPPTNVSSTSWAPV